MLRGGPDPPPTGRGICLEGGCFPILNALLLGDFRTQLHKIYDICSYRQLVASAIYWHSSLVDVCLYLRKTAKTMYCASQQCKQRVNKVLILVYTADSRSTLFLLFCVNTNTHLLTNYAITYRSSWI